MKIEKPNIILLGGGGHCKAVIDVIELENKYQIKGVLDPNSENLSSVSGYPILGNDELMTSLIDDSTFFIITVGQIKSFRIREKLAQMLEENKAQIAKVISPLAYVSNKASIDEGTVVMHKAIVNAEAKVGKHCIINTLANIEHESVIEDFCHISTGTMINGAAIIKRGTFAGSNSTVSNNIIISENSIISAGKFVKHGQ